jgi:periplasmic protein TonB
MLHAQQVRPLRIVRTPQQRLASVTVVVGLHVAVIAAFVFAINPKLILPTTPLCLCYRPVPNPMPPKPAHPDVPRPTLIDPTGVSIPKPDFTISDKSESGPFQNTQSSGGSTNLGGAVDFVAARAIASTHTRPDYPPLDTRLGHEGNVSLRLSIDAQGAVIDAVIVHSSGYDSLDRAAAEWVKAHWRYAPATQGGSAISSSADVTVTFRLTKG